MARPQGSHPARGYLRKPFRASLWPMTDTGHKSGVSMAGTACPDQEIFDGDPGVRRSPTIHIVGELLLLFRMILATGGVRDRDGGVPPHRSNPSASARIDRRRRRISQRFRLRDQRRAGYRHVPRAGRRTAQLLAATWDRGRQPVGRERYGSCATLASGISPVDVVPGLAPARFRRRQLQLHRYRHVVGRLFPGAHVLVDRGRGQQVRASGDKSRSMWMPLSFCQAPAW